MTNVTQIDGSGASTYDKKRDILPLLLLLMAQQQQRQPYERKRRRRKYKKRDKFIGDWYYSATDDTFYHASDNYSTQYSREEASQYMSSQSTPSSGSGPTPMDSDQTPSTPSGNPRAFTASWGPSPSIVLDTPTQSKSPYGHL